MRSCLAEDKAEERDVFINNCDLFERNDTYEQCRLSSG